MRAHKADFEGYQVAVKTGTTQNYRDAWTIGYTPSVVAGIWVGNNDNSPTAKKSGVMLSAPIFHNFMEKVLPEYPKENYQTILKGFNPEDFPIIPQISEGGSILVDSRSFCQGLNQIADIAIPSTAKPEISGIFFVFQKDFIKMAATDSFRLGEKTFYQNLKTPSPLLSKEYTFIPPQKAAKEISSSFPFISPAK